jgi:hypothetical protein
VASLALDVNPIVSLTVAPRHRSHHGPEHPNNRRRRGTHSAAGRRPEDDATFGELTLLPKTMQAVKTIVKVSDELLRQSIIALDRVLKDRLVSDVATTLDNAFLSRIGTTQPLGLLAQPGVQTITVSGAATTDLLPAPTGRGRSRYRSSPDGPPRRRRVAPNPRARAQRPTRATWPHHRDLPEAGPALDVFPPRRPTRRRVILSPVISDEQHPHLLDVQSNDHSSVEDAPAI